MGLEQKPGSMWWYARWMRDGKRHFANLKVKIEGEPGDAKFEASRVKALEAYEATVESADQQKRPEDLVQEIHRVKFGHRIGTVPISGLFEAWKNIPRKRMPKEHYINWAERTFLRLQEFLKTDKDFSRIKEMAAVDKAAAEAFMRAEQDRDISPKTYNAELILLRGAFEHLREDAGMLANPFARIVTKDKETIHRKPFTPDELKAILEAAEDDKLMFPLIVIGVCTAMRRGDACLLKWESVDLQHGYVTVKTSKTGESVEIPVLPMLRNMLEGIKGARKGYVLPGLAKMYLDNPDGVNWRLTKIFEKAGFIDKDVLDKRKERNRDLNVVHRGDVHLVRENLKHRANVRGFHSFRVTWITMALAAGVPMELVRRVTGHKTVDVVLKNYFKPGRDEFRQVVMDAMPKLLTAGDEPEVKEVKAEAVQPDPDETLAKTMEAIDALTPKKLKAQRVALKELVKLLASLPAVKIADPKKDEVAA